MITELLKMSACEVVDALQRGEITSSDILSDLKNRHLEIDPVVNALPTTCFERAFKQAMNLEEQLTKKTSKQIKPYMGYQFNKGFQAADEELKLLLDQRSMNTTYQRLQM